MKQNYRLEKNMREFTKLQAYVLFIEALLLYLYIFTIITYYTYKIKKNAGNYSENDNNHYKYLKFTFFVMPYFLYIINAFLNLTYYSEVIKIQDNDNIFVDRDYFINNEEKLFLL